MTTANNELARVLYTEDQIRVRVLELSREISADYADIETVFLVGVLKGAFIFLADLARCLEVRHVVDFIAVSSYGSRGASS